MSSVVIAISVPTFLKIDTIESLARKQGRLERIKNDFFTLEKITPNSLVSAHLKDEIQTEALSGVYATNAHFPFAILNAKGTDYKKARFIAFGLASYKRELNNEAMDKLQRIFEICPPVKRRFCLR